MLLRFIKNSNLFGTLLIPIAGVLFWMQGFKTLNNISSATEESVMPLYYIVQGLFKGLILWQVLAGFILVILNSLLIARISNSFLSFKKGSSLPAIIYVITISSIKTLQTLHPVHVATLCIIIAIYYIFDTYQKRVDIAFTFNAGFFIAAASMFYFPAVILFPLIWISIFVLQKSDNWRLLIVPVLGFCVPWFLLWAVSFMNNTHYNLLAILKNIIWADNNAYLLDPVFLSISALIILLTLFGSISFLSNYQLIKISARKYFIIFYWMLGLLVLSALSLKTIGNEIIVLTTLPVAFFISQFLLSGRKFFWKELFFLIYIGVMTIAYLI
jgi:hypothetical protein